MDLFVDGVKTSYQVIGQSHPARPDLCDVYIMGKTQSGRVAPVRQITVPALCLSEGGITRVNGREHRWARKESNT